MRQKNIGVVSFQGGVIEHQAIIQKLGHRFQEVRTPKELKGVDALIIPGGESTTIGFFLEQSGLGEAIKKLAGKGMPIWGTCAGAIVLAKKINAQIIPPHLGLMDITVQRNAYGKQIDSFYANLSVPTLGLKDLQAAFIRAPIIQAVNKAKVQILATYQQKIVLVQEGNLLASTFHPELRGDSRLHSSFITLL